MAMTRDVLVTLVEEMLDAVGSSRYGTTLKLQALNVAHDLGWRRILAANRHYRWQTVDVTTDANGRIAVSALSNGTGDSAKRFHKLLDAVQGTVHYRPVNDQSDTLAPTVNPTAGLWQMWRVGDEIQFAPVQSGVTVTVAVNHLPTAPASLASGSSNVVWPESYEWILAYESAALLAGKGSAEVGASLFNKEQAKEMWDSLLADVQRFSTDPLVIGASDDVGDWGSQ